jgi:phosphoglycolate phosphatase-like HAD superfamily hydrolase
MDKLALFDLDGTLLESVGFDADCYIVAVKDVLKLGEVDDNWSHYQHATDAGILAEVYRKNFQGEIPDEISEQVKDRFLAVMLDRFAKYHVRLRPVPGAEQLVHALLTGDEWAVAVSTGSWRESAELKLMNAMLEIRAPIFSCNDAVSRTGIMGLAIETIAKSAGLKNFEKIVYLGDAPWDLKACRELGIGFVGVGPRSAELVSLGASHTLANYADLDLVLKSLEDCQAP